MKRVLAVGSELCFTTESCPVFVCIKFFAADRALRANFNISVFCPEDDDGCQL